MRRTTHEALFALAVELAVRWRRIVSPFTEYGQECVAQTRLTTACLDELLPADDAGPIRLIKIDVDGNEIDVIEGARGIIAAARPLLPLEVADRTQRAAGASAPELRKVEDLGYGFVLDPEEKPVDAHEILPRVEERLVFADVLCLPAHT